MCEWIVQSKCVKRVSFTVEKEIVRVIQTPCAHAIGMPRHHHELLEDLGTSMF